MASGHSAIESVLEKHRYDSGRLLQILRDVQDGLGWIAPETAATIAAGLGIARPRVDSMVQFYSFLYDRPVGQYRILFSDNITDRMQGSIALRDHMLRRLHLKLGEASADGLASVDMTSCTGMCDQGPALLINNRPITRLTLRRIDEICELIRARVPVEEWPSYYFRVEDNIRRADKMLGSAYAIGKALQIAVALGPDRVIEEIKKSSLRGSGGAGFTTAVKLYVCRNTPKGQRYIVCNADEGEPGTFKDRVLLNSFADRIFEGMLICGYATGATEGIVYLRGEYEYLRAQLETRLAELRAKRLLGAGILRRAWIRFRYRSLHGRRRLRLRRGNGAHRVARRQAGAPEGPAALPGDERLQRQANGRQQRRNPVQDHRGDAARRFRLCGPRNETIDWNQADFHLRRLRAAGHLRISVGRAYLHRLG